MSTHGCVKTQTQVQVLERPETVLRSILVDSSAGYHQINKLAAVLVAGRQAASDALFTEPVIDQNYDL